MEKLSGRFGYDLCVCMVTIEYREIRFHGVLM